MKKILTALLLFPCYCFSAIGVTSPVAGLASTANTTSYAMTAFTPTAESLLVVFVSGSNTVVTPTMTGGSLTWVLIDLSIISGTEIAMFYARVGNSPVTTTITYDCTGDAATGVTMSVFQFTGYDALTVNPIKQYRISTSTTTSANASVTFPSALNTSNGYAIFWRSTGTSPASTAPTGWTETDDISFITPSINASAAYRADGETTTGPFDFTNASTTWVVMGVEVYSFGTGPQKQMPLNLLN